MFGLGLLIPYLYAIFISGLITVLNIIYFNCNLDELLVILVVFTCLFCYI